MTDRTSASSATPAPCNLTERKLRQLINRSLDILESALDNTAIPAQVRADIALQILDLVEMELAIDSSVDASGEPSASNGSASASGTGSPDPSNSLAQQPRSSHSQQSQAQATTPQATPPQATPPQLTTPQPSQPQPLSQAPAPTPTSDSPLILPADYVQLEDFLTPGECDEVLQTALGRSPEFVSTSTVGDVSNYRQSSVLWGKWLPDLHSMMRKKILHHLPLVLKQLGLSSFLVSKVEMQMTAHHDGCFYKVHTDASSESTQARQLTYVYYFHREPKAFTGGELKLYETELKGRSSTSLAASEIIEPRNNSIVFFNSRCRHEVLPVSCPSQEFEDGRFTLNGWVRRVGMEPVPVG